MHPQSYYRSKYNLQDDPLISPEELLSMDPIFASWKIRMSTGEFRPLALEDMQNAIRDCQLIPLVPEEVRIVFQGAKMLYVFGYFEYYFLTISAHYLALAVESALRIIHSNVTTNIRKFTPLKTVIDSLIQSGFIQNADRARYEDAVLLRNAMSHLEKPPILPATPEFIRGATVLINNLYDQSIGQYDS